LTYSGGRCIIARTAEYQDLVGESGRAVYRSIEYRFNRIAARTRRELAELRNHTHKWGEDDWCVYCGADGRA
jgi:hypothetical protein